jgi:hypothetical protein
MPVVTSTWSSGKVDSQPQASGQVGVMPVACGTVGRGELGFRGGHALGSEPGLVLRGTEGRDVAAGLEQDRGRRLEVRLRTGLEAAKYAAEGKENEVTGELNSPCRN